MSNQVSSVAKTTESGQKTEFGVLGAISLSHFLNDSTQSLIMALYPMLKGSFHLSFAQIGLITLAFQCTASLFQPLVGYYTDRYPQPYALPVGMACTLAGLLLLSVAPSYPWLLLAAAMVGTGSSIFHPESSRMARLASGGRFGLAQSIFQVGGNAGSSAGPLLAAAIIMPYGQGSLGWFSLLPLLAIVVLLQISRWAQGKRRSGARRAGSTELPLPKETVVKALIVLMILVFSKAFYLASITSYFPLYLMHRFAVPEEIAPMYLFVFLFAVAAGTLIGGPIGDRIGRKWVIWVSILGVAPFTLIMPYVDLFWTGVLSFVIGFILASAFSAIIVFAQELVPGRVGTIAGLFFGLTFGLGGIGAAVLGKLADWYGIEFVYMICSFLPLLGVLTIFLPSMKRKASV